MQLSENGLNLIKGFENCDLMAYLDQGGRSTIGYGHLNKERFVTITQEQADALLESDCSAAVNCVNANVTVPLNQNQFDALTSLVFNIGSGNFINSTLLNDLNEKEYDCAAEQFLVWNKVTNSETGELEVSNGLIARREKEKQLFLS